MRVTRDWNHDSTTELLAEQIAEALEVRIDAEDEPDEGLTEVRVWSDEGGLIEVSAIDPDTGDTRRFRLVLEEVV